MIEIIKDKKDIENYLDILNKRGAMNGGQYLPTVQEIIADVIKNGEILGIVPKTYIPNYGEFYEKRWFRSGKDIKN